MGFAPSQTYAVPFLVLNKVIQQQAKKPSEANEKALKLVLETCVRLVKDNEEFKNRIIQSARNFSEEAKERTQDIVPSIPVLLAQIYCLNKVEGLEDNFKLSEEELNAIFRFAVEEERRRQLGRNAEPLERKDLLNLIDPDHVQFFNDMTQKFTSQMQKASEGDNKFGVYQAQAAEFRKLKGVEAEEAKAEEENKKEGMEVEKQTTPEEDLASRIAANSVVDVLQRSAAAKSLVEKAQKDTNDYLP